MGQATARSPGRLAHPRRRRHARAAAATMSAIVGQQMDPHGFRPAAAKGRTRTAGDEATRRKESHRSPQATRPTTFGRDQNRRPRSSPSCMGAPGARALARNTRRALLSGAILLLLAADWPLRPLLPQPDARPLVALLSGGFHLTWACIARSTASGLLGRSRMERKASLDELDAQANWRGVGSTACARLARSVGESHRRGPVGEHDQGDHERPPRPARYAALIR